MVPQRGKAYIGSLQKVQGEDPTQDGAYFTKASIQNGFSH